MNDDGQSVEDLIGAGLDREIEGDANQGEDNGETKGSTGSEPPKTDATVEEKLVTMPDGRQLTPDQVLEEYTNLQKDYTIKTQELSKLKDQPTGQSKGEDGKPTDDDGFSELSSRDQAMVKEIERLGFTRVQAVKKLAGETLDSKSNELIAKAASTATAQSELKSALSELSTDFDGSKENINNIEISKPKVDPKEVLQFIIDNKGTNLSPLEIAKALHPDDFIKYETDKRMAETKQGSGEDKGNTVPKTEGSGAAVTEPPTGTPPTLDTLEDRMAATLGVANPGVPKL